MPNPGTSHDDHLSTGIEDLDDQLGGGIPAGSVVSLKTRPDSQSELLLYSIVSERETLYISTIRNERAVKDTFEDVGISLDPYVTYATPDAAIQEVSKTARRADNQMNIIIDSVEMMESDDRGKYQKFLNDIQNHIRNIGGAVILHCYKDSGYENRMLTDAMSDLILDLETEIDGTSVEHYIHVPKYRRGEAFTERVKLRLTDAVTVDTSRDIA